MQRSSRPIPFFGDFSIGLLSPLYSLKFLRNNKSLLFIGLAPQVLGAAVFVWLTKLYLLPLINTYVVTEFPTSWQTGILANFVMIIVGFLLLLVFGLIYVPFISALASPVYDFIAAKTYEISTGLKLPRQGLRAIFSGVISEFIKLAVYFSILTVAFFVPLVAPFFLIFSVWYLGWDHLDRTLILMNKTLVQRALFGIRHAPACLMLGIWSYLPLIGGLLGFSFASAGALAVGKLAAMKPSNKETKNETGVFP